MKFMILVIAILVMLTGSVYSSDLYEVIINNNTQAEFLKSIKAEPLIQLDGGYLVLLDQQYLSKLQESNIEYDLVQTNILKDEIYIDGRKDKKNLEYFRPLYVFDNIRLFKIDNTSLSLSENQIELFPLRNDFLEIKYYPQKEDKILALDMGIELDTLVAKVSQDSLDSYLHRLEAFYRRLTGTDSAYAARDWIEAKFRSFGYDSVYTDPFIGQQLWARDPVQSHNVVAVKIGTEYPDQQIVIGGHFDAVPNCPGVDDNGTGTTGTLEIARVLADVETPMTIVFIAFDSEESGLHGAYHYVNDATNRNDDIILMLNMDMIGHITNNSHANLYTGVETAYAELWDQLGSTLFGITGGLSGSTGSDHLPFQNAGFDVIFVQEGFFSTEYHQPSDSTSYTNFEYMTRMVKTTLATAYNTMNVPPPVRITLIEEPGDGQSLNIYWEGLEPSLIDHYSLRYFPTSSPASIININLASNIENFTVTGLQDNTEYGFYVRAFEIDGDSSYAYNTYYDTPSSKPTAPFNVQGSPMFEAIQLVWRSFNDELDFDHFGIIRDNVIVGTTTDTFFVDDSQLLGSAPHSYFVVAVDDDDNISDTVGVEPIVLRAASLDPGFILALNRSTTGSNNYTDEIETGVFLREALDGYNFTYYSDTSSNESITLDEMLDYEMIVVGDESGRGVDITHYRRPIIADLALYMSIGGKVIIFGRYGDFGDPDTLVYNSVSTDFDDRFFYDYFHINFRVTSETRLATPDSLLSDLIGADNVMQEYPYLPWDSLQTSLHSEPRELNSGIPIASFVDLSSPNLDILYTYVSRDANPDTQGKPVAWRHRGVDYRYIFMDIPLSFINRDSAIVALRTAVDDLLYGATAIDDDNENLLPAQYTLYQNYPNPFNPVTRIDYNLPVASNVTLKVYNILGQEVKLLVNSREKPGHKTVYWDGKNNTDSPVATGLYFYRLTAGDFTETKKMLLLK